MKQLTPIILLSLFTIGSVQSQTHATNETPIVIVSSIESDAIIGIELLKNFWDKSEDDVLVSYPNCKFYKGLLKGEYERTESLIIPEKGAIITIYTNEQIFLRESFLTESQHTPGDSYTIGKTKSKIISNQKGELILRIE